MCYDISLERGDIMAYYLTYEKKKQEYIPLDITKSACFTRLSRLKGMGSEINEIDMFTTSFNHEQELRMHLLSTGILPLEYSSKKLSVRKKEHDDYKKVMYDILYQKDLQYLADPNTLIRRINNKLVLCDFEFISEYASHFAKDYGCSSTALEVLRYARDSIRMDATQKHFYDRDENGDMELTRLTKLLIYNHYSLRDGRIIYTNKINNLNLHRVIAFINNYDKKMDEEKTKIDSEKNISITSISKPKARKKEKKKNIPGQTSLFD